MKFNPKTGSPRAKDSRTYEGAAAYSYRDPRNELIAAVATTFLDDKYYESGRGRMQRIENLINKVLEMGEYQFLWNLAYITREEWHLRSVTHLIAGHLIGSTKHRAGYPKDAHKVLSKLWRRPDDMSNTVGYWVHQVNGGLNKKQGGKEGFPYLLSRAVEHRFNQLSMFQAAKYHQVNTQFGLFNLMRIVRPKAKNDEQNRVFRAIADHWKQVKRGIEAEVKLPTTESNWRAKVDKQISSEGKSKKEAFEASIPKMGLFGVLNNLNTFDRHGVDPELAIARLKDKQAVIRSKLLPFRFITAIEQVDRVEYKNALKQALEYSFENLVLPRDKNFLIAVDTSGSMNGRPVDIASTFGAILAKKAELDPSNKVHVVAFSTTLKRVDTYDMGIFALKDKIIHTDVGWATNGHLVYEYAKRKDTPRFDYIFSLTDMQYHSMFQQDPPKESLLINVNLQGYNNTQTPFDGSGRVVELTGISEKVFDYLDIVSDPQGMIEYISNYEIKLEN